MCRYTMQYNMPICNARSHQVITGKFLGILCRNLLKDSFANGGASYSKDEVQNSWWNIDQIQMWLEGNN